MKPFRNGIVGAVAIIFSLLASPYVQASIDFQVTCSATVVANVDYSPESSWEHGGGDLKAYKRVLHVQREKSIIKTRNVNIESSGEIDVSTFSSKEFEETPHGFRWSNLIELPEGVHTVNYGYNTHSSKLVVSVLAIYEEGLITSWVTGYDCVNDPG